MARVAWSMVAQHSTSASFDRQRAKDFCCSAVYVTRDMDCAICPAEHGMVERRMYCISPTCASKEIREDGELCAVEWRTWECTTTSNWHIYRNGKNHIRGDKPCTGSHRVPITTEVREYCTRIDACGMQPRKIWSSLRRAPDISFSRFPPRQQIADLVKRLRKKNLSRNTRQSVKNLTQEFPYFEGIDAEKAFLFGPVNESDGFPLIGKGSDADPFVLGVTTLSLLAKVNQLQDAEHFKLFHTDATFKLSDLGYPVITCGFTDRSRVYHLAAILVVSARTHREYEMAFRSIARTYQRIYHAALRVDAIMGDAEAAQLNALRNLSEFSESKYLMCFFHVLYNVHKRTRHLPTGPGVAVFTGIMDMHYTTSYVEYCAVKDRVISEWRTRPMLRSFVDYFQKEWIGSRFWRWQIYHSPSSYATTNNPCEVFNASVKRHVQRKSSEICVLFRSMIVLAEDVGCDVPSPSASIAAPIVEMKQTAKWMLKSKAVAVITTDLEAVARVLHVLEIHIDDEAFEMMQGLASSVINQNGDEASMASLVLGKAEKTKASRLYCDSVKWSTRRAHRVVMPDSGWIVNVEDMTCGCSIHITFGVCAHLAAARSVLGARNGFGVGDKLMCRRARKNRRTQRSYLTSTVSQRADTQIQNTMDVSQVGEGAEVDIGSSRSRQTSTNSPAHIDGLHVGSIRNEDYTSFHVGTYQEYRHPGSTAIAAHYTSECPYHNVTRNSQDTIMDDVPDFSRQLLTATNHVDIGSTHDLSLGPRTAFVQGQVTHSSVAYPVLSHSSQYWPEASHTRDMFRLPIPSTLTYEETPVLSQSSPNWYNDDNQCDTVVQPVSRTNQDRVLFGGMPSTRQVGRPPLATRALNMEE